MTAAERMDHFADWIGTFIPGGSRLPARHPVKVTLVMGLLGLCSGWASMAVGLGVGAAVGINSPRESIVFGASGAVYGLAVLIPWAMWNGVSARWWAGLVIYSLVANAICFALIDEIGRTQSNYLLATFLFGMVTGIYLGVAALLLRQQRRIFWYAAFVLLCGFVAMTRQSFVRQPALTQYLPDEIHLPLIIAWFFSTCHTPTAIGLGFLLWDSTPKPKFEPADNDVRPKSEP